MLEKNFDIAFLLFAIAGISDAIDGFLAKRYDWQSRLGSILDPLADKALLITSFAVLSYLQLLPWWLFFLVISRDLVIVLGALAYHHKVGQFNFLPLWSSKINTLLQICLLLWIMLQQQWFPADEVLSTFLFWGVVISTLYSGFEYLLVWGKRAWRQTIQN